MAGAGRFTPQNGGKLDRIVGDVAAAQHGLTTLAQLRGIGVTPRMVESRVRRGFLIRLYRGVFAVGHAPITDEARWLAAVLACGPDAVLSHGQAGALWRVRSTLSPRIDVTARTRRGFTVDAITVHRATTLTPEDRDAYRGVPVTSLPRTIIDLATSIPPSSLEYAIHRAEAQRKLTPADLHEALARNPGVPGTVAVRRIIGAPATTSTPRPAAAGRSAS